jgi:hypothetical protein
MSDATKKTFPVAKVIPINQAGDGFNEIWLQNLICDDPSVLKLGDLEFVTREKTQWKNGRLDILLKDPTNDKMFEVEVMLGETDEKHIIHTIEYWDNEKRKFPQRQHFPVLVAESFDRRFFNIIHLFSQTIPLIAVQVNLVEVAGVRSLNFSKIIDVYQEPEETSESTYEQYDEAKWNEKSSWTVDAAKTLLEIIKPVYPDGKLHYVKSYIAIEVGRENRVRIFRRSANKSCIGFWFTPKLLPKAVELLDAAEIASEPDNQHVWLIMDSNSLKKYQTTIVQVAEISKAAWEE